MLFVYPYSRLSEMMGKFNFQTMCTKRSGQLMSTPAKPVVLTFAKPKVSNPSTLVVVPFPE
ncbi:hypothetical protein CR513_45837, partial [Mucuna pruriens]